MQAFSIKISVPFFLITHQACHCEEGAILCARRGNLKRNEAASRNEIRRTGMKQPETAQGSITHHVFHIMCTTFRSVLPCFVTGCHSCNFKIATAALRPRNDITDWLYGKQIGFLNERFQICCGATPQRAPMGHGFTQAFACTSLAQASCTRLEAALHAQYLSLRGSRGATAQRHENGRLHKEACRFLRRAISKFAWRGCFRQVSPEYRR